MNEHHSEKYLEDLVSQKQLRHPAAVRNVIRIFFSEDNFDLPVVH